VPKIEKIARIKNKAIASLAELIKFINLFIEPPF
jgi:hypothetical protein